MKNLEFRLLQTNTPGYKQMMDLRLAVLLAPIGISRSYINPEKEADDLLIGCYANAQLVGCCILTRLSTTIVQLRQMAVATPWQSKGVGAAMLCFAEALAKEKGYQTLVLHARDTVIGFYQKCGYQLVGQQFFEVGIGHHKMQKNFALANHKDSC